MGKFTAVLLCLAACVLTGCKKGPSKSSTAHAERPSYFKDEEVASAWETVEKFSRAWCAKNFPAAKALFSPELNSTHEELVLRECVVGLPNHVHESAKILSGRRIGEGRVEFTLGLTIVSKGAMTDRRQEEEWNIVLVRYNTMWLIDSIPIPRSRVPTE